MLQFPRWILVVDLVLSPDLILLLLLSPSLLRPVLQVPEPFTTCAGAGGAGGDASGPVPAVAAL